MPWSRRTATGTGQCRRRGPRWRLEPISLPWPPPPRRVSFTRRASGRPCWCWARSAQRSSRTHWPPGRSSSPGSLTSSIGLPPRSTRSSRPRPRQARQRPRPSGDAPAEQAAAVAGSVVDAAAGLRLAGAMTHFATADGDLEFVDRQLEAFTRFVTQLRPLAPSMLAHAANSAATLRVPASHLDMVRCGIAVYGSDPMNEDPAPHRLEPALDAPFLRGGGQGRRTGRQRWATGGASSRPRPPGWALCRSGTATACPGR